MNILSTHSHWLCALAVLALAACASDAQVQQQAREAWSKGDTSTSLALLQKGMHEHPDSVKLKSQWLQLRAEAVENGLREAAAQLQKAEFDACLSALHKVLAIEPTNSRALELAAEVNAARRQHKSLLEASTLAAQDPYKALRLVEQALKDNPNHAGLRELQGTLDAKIRQEQMAAAATLAEARPVSLDFKDAPLRTVLDVISRNSGVNFVMDKDLRSDARVTVYLKDTRVEEALDLVTSTNQLAKKVLDPRTVVIYPNTPDKQREYQEQVVRVFYLANAEAKAAAAFLRSMLRLKEPFVDERSNLLALREAPEVIQMAERLVALFDANEPEVLLELEVLEVASNRLTELGVRLPESFSLTPLVPSGATELTLGNIAQLGRNTIGVGVGPATVNLRRTVGDVTTLANPQIRARNREKASILIGDKVPVVSATTGTNGFVSDTVTYLDVGLKLNVEPTVYADDDVAIRVNLEVSSLGSAVKTASGTMAYQIGTRSASTLLRLHDGETQMLAGLISKEDRTTSSRLPGAGDLPMVGRLFRNQTDTANKSELVLAITPRVLRNVRRPQAHEAEMWVGTDNLPRLRPYGGINPSKAVREPKPSTQSMPLNASEGPSASTSTATSGAKPEVRVWLKGPQSVKVGEAFKVQVQLKSGAGLRGLPIELQLDPTRVELMDVEEGDFFKQGDAATNFSRGSMSESGIVAVSVMRNQATVAQGEATVATLTLRAKERGIHDVSVAKVTALTIGTSVQVAPTEALELEAVQK